MKMFLPLIRSIIEINRNEIYFINFDILKYRILYMKVLRFQISLLGVESLLISVINIHII